MNLYSAEQAAQRIGKSRRRILQIAKRDGIGQMVGNGRVFSGMDLAKLRGRRLSRVSVEIHLEEGVYRKLEAEAQKKEMSPGAYLNKVLHTAYADKD